MDVARAQKSGSIRSRPLCCQQSPGKERESRVGRGKEWGGGGRGEWVQNGQGKFWDEKLLCLISYETEVHIVRNISSFIKSEASFYL